MHNESPFNQLWQNIELHSSSMKWTENINNFI